MEKTFPSEHEEQAEVVRWFEKTFTKDQAIIFAIPNGGWRDKRTAKMLKDEGVKKGVCDLCIILSSGFTFYIEMKRVKEARPSVSKDQHDFMDFLRNAGIESDVGYGALDAKKKIINILKKYEKSIANKNK